MPSTGFYMVAALAAVNQFAVAAPLYAEEDVELDGRSSSSIFEHGSLGSQNSIFDHTGSIICGPNSQTVGGICVPPAGGSIGGAGAGDSVPASNGGSVPASDGGSVVDPNSINIGDSFVLPDSILTPIPSGDSTADLPSATDLSADGSVVDVPSATGAPSATDRPVMGGDLAAQTSQASRPSATSSSANRPAATQSGQPAAPKMGAASPMTTNAVLMIAGVALAAFGF